MSDSTLDWWLEIIRATGSPPGAYRPEHATMLREISLAPLDLRKKLIRVLLDECARSPEFLKNRKRDFGRLLLRAAAGWNPDDIDAIYREIVEPARAQVPPQPVRGLLLDLQAITDPWSPRTLNQALLASVFRESLDERDPSGLIEAQAARADPAEAVRVTEQLLRWSAKAGETEPGSNTRDLLAAWFAPLQRPSAESVSRTLLDFVAASSHGRPLVWIQGAAKALGGKLSEAMMREWIGLAMADLNWQSSFWETFGWFEILAAAAPALTPDEAERLTARSLELEWPGKDDPAVRIVRADAWFLGAWEDWAHQLRPEAAIVAAGVVRIRLGLESRPERWISAAFMLADLIACCDASSRQSLCESLLEELRRQDRPEMLPVLEKLRPCFPIIPDDKLAPALIRAVEVFARAQERIPPMPKPFLVRLMGDLSPAVAKRVLPAVLERCTGEGYEFLACLPELIRKLPAGECEQVIALLRREAPGLLLAAAEKLDEREMIERIEQASWTPLPQLHRIVPSLDAGRAKFVARWAFGAADRETSKIRRWEAIGLLRRIASTLDDETVAEAVDYLCCLLECAEGSEDVREIIAALAELSPRLSDKAALAVFRIVRDTLAASGVPPRVDSLSRFARPALARELLEVARWPHCSWPDRSGILAAVLTVAPEGAPRLSAKHGIFDFREMADWAKRLTVPPAS